MEFEREVVEEENFVKTIFNRFRKKNFTGNTGQAIKNSSFQLTQNIVMKVGSLLFTIALARILMPEKMGLYSLALSTIVLFSSFSDLGIGSAIITYISKSLGKGDKEKAKGYFKKLFYWKSYLLGIVSIVLLVASYFVANNYYNKPIFYALLVGAFYIPIVGLLGFFENGFKSTNNFRVPLNKELIFQIARLILIPGGALILLKLNLSLSILTAAIISLAVLSYFVAFIYLGIKSKNLSFLKVKASNLNEGQNKDLKKFIYPLGAMALSGMFFGYIDIIMLGHYVASEFISYYQAAFSLVASASAILGFAAMALLPLFSKLEGKRLENLFRKTRNFVFLISLVAAVITFFLAHWIVLIAYGSAYLSASKVLALFSVLILFLPVVGLYNNYYISQKRTKVLMWLIIAATILNIVLNFVGINYGLSHFGGVGAIIGATVATIISRIAYFVGLTFGKRRK